MEIVHCSGLTVQVHPVKVAPLGGCCTRLVLEHRKKYSGNSKTSQGRTNLIWWGCPLRGGAGWGGAVGSYQTRTVPSRKQEVEQEQE